MNTKQDNIIRTDYAEIMQKSYIDYAMSVIISRALPDVRDGLKPVQRRTLYDMYELGIRYDRPYRKCARIVGDTMGKYHPHGDSSIYDALVVMAQDFKKGRTLVDGHGNFGSIEGDGAAAMRYTEARLEKLTQEVFLGDLDKNVVDFVPNFDETEKEPSVLPVKIPNILVNGAEGIAVGMATSIPSHNLGEVVDAVKAYMKDNTISVKGLMRYIKGPDFPTGGIVINKDELTAAYETIKNELGSCDILINGAGGNQPGAITSIEMLKKEKEDSDYSFWNLDEDRIRDVMDLNYMGTLLPIQVFTKDMVEKRSGSIINIASVTSILPLTKVMAYGNAKSAILNLTQWLAVHFGESGIRCNAIAPGFYAAEQNHDLLFNADGSYTDRATKIITGTPMGRFGNPEELIGAALFLASDETASFVNGIVLPVDGGYSAYSGV